MTPVKKGATIAPEVVAYAELAQSYMAQPKMVFLSFLTMVLNLVLLRSLDAQGYGPLVVTINPNQSFCLGL